MRLSAAKFAAEPVKTFAEVAQELLSLVKPNPETAALFVPGSREPQAWVVNAIKRAYYDYTRDTILALETWKDGSWKTLTKRANPVAFNATSWASRFSEDYAEEVFNIVNNRSGRSDEAITLSEDEKRRLQPILSEIILRKTSANFAFHFEAVVFFLNGIIMEAREKAELAAHDAHRKVRFASYLTKDKADALLADAQADDYFRGLYVKDFLDNEGSTASTKFLADFTKPSGFRPPRPSLDAEFKTITEQERDATATKRAAAVVAQPDEVAPTSPASKPAAVDPASFSSNTPINVTAAMGVIEKAMGVTATLSVFQRKGAPAHGAFKRRFLANLKSSKTIPDAAKKGKDGIKKYEAARSDVLAVSKELVDSGRVPLLSLAAAATKIVRAAPFIDRMVKAHSVLRDHAQSGMKNAADKKELAKRLAKITSIYEDYLSEDTEANTPMSPGLLARLGDLEKSLAAGYPSMQAKAAEPVKEAKPAAKKSTKKAAAKKPAKKAAKKSAAKKAAKKAVKKPAAKKPAKKAAAKKPAKKAAKKSKK